MKWPPIEVELWNADMSRRYAPNPREISGLSYTTSSGVGFGNCSFKMIRDPRRYWPDLDLCNQVRLRSGLDIAWEGEIVSRTVDIAGDMSIAIECYGPGNRLYSRLTTVNVGQERGSQWIIDHMFSDVDLDLDMPGSVVDTNDFIFPYGIDVSPAASYLDVLDIINKCNNYDIGVWENRSLRYEPKSDDITITANVEDAETSMAYMLEDIVNRLRVTYSADGANYSHFWWPAADAEPISSELYRRRDRTLSVQGKSSLEQAQTIAEIFLAEKKRMRPATSLVVTRVYDAGGGQERNPARVRCGEVIYINNLYPMQLAVSETNIVNELSTFRVVETQYEPETGRLTLAPGNMSLMMEKILARIEARTKI